MYDVYLEFAIPSIWFVTAGFNIKYSIHHIYVYIYIYIYTLCMMLYLEFAIPSIWFVTVGFDIKYSIYHMYIYMGRRKLACRSPAVY